MKTSSLDMQLESEAKSISKDFENEYSNTVVLNHAA
jgi:hypothetical protein